MHNFWQRINLNNELAERKKVLLEKVNKILEKVDYNSKEEIYEQLIHLLMLNVLLLLYILCNELYVFDLVYLP